MAGGGTIVRTATGARTISPTGGGIPTGSFLAGAGSIVRTSTGARAITPMGTGDPRNFSIPYTPPTYLQPPNNDGGGSSYGGGRGGGYGGGGGGGNYQQPVITPGIGNDVNVALNWRVG